MVSDDPPRQRSKLTMQPGCLLASLMTTHQKGFKRCGIVAGHGFEGARGGSGTLISLLGCHNGMGLPQGLDRLLMADSPTSQFPSTFFNSSASLYPASVTRLRAAFWASASYPIGTSTKFVTSGSKL